MVRETFFNEVKSRDCFHNEWITGKLRKIKFVFTKNMSQSGIVWDCSCNLLRITMSYREQPSHKHAVKFNKNHVSDLLFHHIDFVCKLVWLIVIIMLCLQHINRPISTIHIAQTLANNLALYFVIVHVGGKNNLGIFSILHSPSQPKQKPTNK